LVVDERPLPDDIVPDVINTFLAHGLDVWIYRGTDFYVRSAQASHVDREAATVQFRPTVVHRVIQRFSRFLNVPLKSIATIGDQPNDVYMFKPSGLSIAMGNASPEVQRQANYVTTSYEDEGFANAVERFFLPRAPAPE